MRKKRMRRRSPRSETIMFGSCLSIIYFCACPILFSLRAALSVQPLHLMIYISIFVVNS